jgi:beta-lactamase regulating signal transducer with metallopeptidase domain
VDALDLERMLAELLSRLPAWYLWLSVYVTLLGAFLLHYVFTRQRPYLKTLAATATPSERTRLGRAQARSIARAVVLTVGGPLLLLDLVWIQVLLAAVIPIGITARVRDMALGVAVAREAEHLGIEPQESRVATIEPTAEDYALSFGLQMVLRVIPSLLLVIALWYV